MLTGKGRRRQLRNALLAVTVAAVIAFFAVWGLHSPAAKSGGRGSEKSVSDALITATASSGGQLMTVDPSGGYWTVTWLGVVITHGGAPSFGSPALSGVHLNEPIVAMAATPDGGGYWLVASDGGVFSFGDAHFYGSTGAIHLNEPIVGMAATPDGGGYWLVASDGGVFSFGDAHFYGSTGAIHLNEPIVGMAATPDGGGYWLVASDGGVFSFGDAHFYGSTGAIHLNEPIIGMAATPDGGGYWLVASDGGVFSFGDAGYFGSLAGTGVRVIGIIVDPPTPGYSLVQVDGAATAMTSTTSAGAPTSPTASMGTGSTTTTTTTTTSSPTSTVPTVPVVGSSATGLTPGTPGMNFANGETDVYNSSYADQLATMARVKAAGTQWLRWNLPMVNEEPSPGDFNWYTTQEIQAALAEGLKVDALLTSAPAWASTAAGAPGDGSPSPTAFAAFAKAAVEEYAPLGVTTYEIWNEENDTQPWGTAFTPAEYTALLQASYAAIKSVDPTATVISGGFAPAPDTSNGTSYEPVTFLTQMYADGAKGSFDALADHPYSFPDLPDQPDSWNPFTYLPTLHQIMVANGDGSKQIWLTEYGAPTSGVSGSVTPAFQAESITDAFQWAQQYSWIGPLFIFDWQASSYDDYGDYGLYNADGSSTPGAAAYSAAALSYGG